MDSFLQDLRHGIRSLRSTPGVCLVAVLTIGLGVGATTSIFSVVEGVLLRDLPYANPDRLVMVWEHNLPRDRRQNVVNPGNFQDWRRQASSFSGLAGFWDYRATLTGSGEPEELYLQAVTSELFEVLGVEARIGRVFGPRDARPESPPVVVLSHRLWQRRFGADPGLVGESIELDGTPVTVVGVMPEGFRVLDADAALWLARRVEGLGRDDVGRFMMVVGRLAEGASLAEARAEMDTIGARLREAYPDFNAGWGVHLVPIHEQVVGDVRPALLVLLGAVGMLLLVACANVASLMLARSTTRRRELAVRRALGAGRGRVARLVLAESVALALTGGVLGLVVAWIGTEGVVALGADGLSLPRLERVAMNGRVLTFAFGISALTGVLFGMVPAFQSSRAELDRALREDARGSTGGRGVLRARNLLVVVEVALALVLLVGAGLLVRSFAELTRVDPGFETASVLTLRVTAPPSRYPDADDYLAYQDRLFDRIGALPGVEAVGSIQFLPLSGMRSGTSYFPEDRPEPEPGQHPAADVRVVGGDFFAAAGIPVLRGRTFDSRDRADAADVAVVNRTLAREHWPDRDPIGRRLALSWGDWISLEVVGVVEDIRYGGPDVEPRPAVYRPVRQDPWRLMGLVVGAEGEDGTALAPSVVAAIREIEPEQAVTGIQTLEEALAGSMAGSRMNLALLGLFAGVALVLAVVGIYGVVAYAVGQRIPEFGIRMALGARSVDVVGLVVARGAGLVAAGVGLGLLAALGLTRLLEGLLFGVGPLDPPTFVAVALLLLGVGVVASLIPAARGSRADPASALRDR